MTLRSGRVKITILRISRGVIMTLRINRVGTTSKGDITTLRISRGAIMILRILKVVIISRAAITTLINREILTIHRISRAEVITIHKTNRVDIMTLRISKPGTMIRRIKVLIIRGDRKAAIISPRMVMLTLREAVMAIVKITMVNLLVILLCSRAMIRHRAGCSLHRISQAAALTHQVGILERPGARMSRWAIQQIPLTARIPQISLYSARRVIGEGGQRLPEGAR